MDAAWALRNLRRRPLRSALSLAGIAVATALLLDMVLLSGGIERSFERLLLSRGYQLRLSPKGTLPFDTEATLDRVGPLVARLRADPDIAAAGPVLGAALHVRGRDSLVTVFGYGIDPAQQAVYVTQSGRDLAAGDTTGVLLGPAAAAAMGVTVGDTIRVLGGLDPQFAGATIERALVVRGTVRWLYDYRGQHSIGVMLPLMQRLTHQAEADRASFVVVKVRDGRPVPAVQARLQRELPAVAVNSIADLVEVLRRRLVYFRQLSYILGTVSLAVAVLLVTTLLTIGVNERLGEIATLRAIGVSRRTIVGQVLVEGAALTLAGGALGIALGAATARYLDGILTRLPGLPAAISFFVPQAGPLAIAALVLAATGLLAGLYPAWLAARLPVAATLRAEAT